MKSIIIGKIRKKCLGLFMFIAVLAVSSLPASAATFEDMNAPAVFLKQQTNVTCTLCSATMMVRRAALASGNTNWKAITESAMKKTAWVTAGLRNSFTYSGISVKSSRLSGGSGNTTKLISLLKDHPEGVVIYDFAVPHAILLTDYTDGKFYCADPGKGIKSGRIPISSASIKVNNADKYWYVSSPKVTLTKSGYNPEGAVDVIEGGEEKVRVRGWAIDRDIPTSVVNVQVYIGSEGPYTFVAGQYRPDLDKSYVRGDYHGFDVTIPTKVTGSSVSVSVYAVNIGAGNGNTRIGGKQVKITAHTHKYETVITRQPTCGSTGSSYEKCSICGAKREGSDKVIPATGLHSYGDWMIVRQPSVMEEGSRERVCSVCAGKQSEAIPRLKATIELNVTGTVFLNVKGTFAAKVTKMTTGDAVQSWSSSNVNVAGVAPDGKVTGKQTGSANIKVTLKSGISASFDVKVQNLAKTPIIRLSKKGTGIRVQYKKNSAGDGYQIQYSRDPGFKNAKSVYVKNPNCLVKTVGSSLKGIWYVRVRAYKFEMGKSGAKFFSPWSDRVKKTMK